MSFITESKSGSRIILFIFRRVLNFRTSIWESGVRIQIRSTATIIFITFEFGWTLIFCLRISGLNFCFVDMAVFAIIFGGIGILARTIRQRRTTFWWNYFGWQRLWWRHCYWWSYWSSIGVHWVRCWAMTSRESTEKTYWALYGNKVSEDFNQNSKVNKRNE